MLVLYCLYRCCRTSQSTVYGLSAALRPALVFLSEVSLPLLNLKPDHPTFRDRSEMISKVCLVSQKNFRGFLANASGVPACCELLEGILLGIGRE